MRIAKSKFGNIPTVVDGITFASRAESERYRELKILGMAGAIRNLHLQPSFEIHPAFTDNEGKRHRKVCYVADFQYTEGRQVVCEDVKGKTAPLTPIFLLKSKLFLARYPGIKLVIVRC